MKLVAKSRNGSRIRKHFDKAQTPLCRLLTSGTLSTAVASQLTGQRGSLNPLTLRRELERLIMAGAAQVAYQAAAAEY